MAGQLRLSETQLSDFSSIVELPEEVLRSILDHLNELTPAPMSQEEVRRLIAEVLPEEPRKVESISRQVLALAGLQYRSDIPYDELMAALRASLAARIEKNALEAWDLVSPIFRDILACQPIRITVKSLDLRYDYENLTRSTNVLTDVRPIFDDDADRVIGAIVSFTLRLNYENGDSTRSLSLAMDAEDITRLQRQCERALKKAETARTQFSEHDAPRTRIEISGKFEQ
jgi:hypothetical protein